MRDYFHTNPPPNTHIAARRQYKVARGDTLSEIALRHDVSISSIKLANNMGTEMVRAGEVLKIP